MNKKYMNHEKFFNRQVEGMLNEFMLRESRRFPQDETLTIDLHCHDHHSSVPDELLGRILGLPETWLSTERLLSVLREHGSDAFTITNHNNARSCWEYIDKGYDILPGAEWSCMVPDYKIGIHVLAYGFTQDQEKWLARLRSDVYKFQEYAAEHDIPTVWAHPLYQYKLNNLPPVDFFNNMALLFERFEVINGQRDTWQNMLVKTWLESLNEEKIELFSRKFKIPSGRYCRNPYLKAMSGGSDDHMGIFTGLTGTRLHVPGLKAITGKKTSELALDAIRKGLMAPFGSHNDSEKMAVAFLDYFCQVGINMRDPGMMRILLHKGETRDKLIAFMIANGFSELKRHKTTLNFLKIFHDSFSGKVPPRTKRLFVPKAYKEVFRLAQSMAVIRRDEPERSLGAFDSSIREIYENLNLTLINRIEKKIEKLDRESDVLSIGVEDIINRIEIPAHIRSLFDDDASVINMHEESLNLPELLDGLSFPFLALVVILAAFYTSARVMYKTRPLLYEFAEIHGTLRHPERTLWLTDTLEDSNGVAMVLKSMLEEIRRRDLPIDMLIASNNLESGDHLIVLKPLSEFRLSFYEQQPVRIPNILEIHKLFKEGEYSRIICSTEGPMGFAALYLKYAYSVPAYFYVHTDWMTFAEKTLRLDEKNMSRLRRMLRAFYKGFDGLFVLNKEQWKWLIGRDMGFDPSRVFLTAHWADKGFSPRSSDKKSIFNVENGRPVLLFAGRLSDEKGVMEIPSIFEKVRAAYPDVHMAFAGSGPREKDLKEALPDATYLGWVDQDMLPDIYSAADMLVLPSRFDTFGCVVLEALSCGLPVIAYNTKGPKDIIVSGLNGYLVKTRSEMAAKIIEYLKNIDLRESFRKESLKRAGEYDPDTIITRFMKDLNTAA
jgi:glycosyltransferase involved in cell wall biosynthesis